MMKFSVITVCRNAEETLEATIRSVLEQVYPHVEYIVVDGGSTDGTMEIIRRYADRITHCVSEGDNGIYDAMNKGIGLATGDYMYFLNADDTFVDCGILKKVDGVLAVSRPDVAVGDVLLIGLPRPRRHPISVCLDRLFPLENNVERISEMEGVRVARKRQKSLDKLVMYYRCPAQQGVFFSRRAFEKCGLFNADFFSAGDYEWLLRAFFSNMIKPQYMDLVIANFRWGWPSTDPRFEIKRKKELLFIAGQHYSVFERFLLFPPADQFWLRFPDVRRWAASLITGRRAAKYLEKHE